jgi:hypothetical protein
MPLTIFTFDCLLSSELKFLDSNLKPFDVIQFRNFYTAEMRPYANKVVGWVMHAKQESAMFIFLEMKRANDALTCFVTKGILTKEI